MLYSGDAKAKILPIPISANNEGQFERNEIPKEAACQWMKNIYNIDISNYQAGKYGGTQITKDSFICNVGDYGSSKPYASISNVTVSSNGGVEIEGFVGGTMDIEMNPEMATIFYDEELHTDVWGYNYTAHLLPAEQTKYSSYYLHDIDVRETQDVSKNFQTAQTEDKNAFRINDVNTVRGTVTCVSMNLPNGDSTEQYILTVDKQDGEGFSISGGEEFGDDILYGPVELQVVDMTEGKLNLSEYEGEKVEIIGDGIEGVTSYYIRSYALLATDIHAVDAASGVQHQPNLAKTGTYEISEYDEDYRREYGTDRLMYEYSVVVEEVSDGSITFNVGCAGSNWSPVYVTDMIHAELDGNLAVFSWQDSWGNKGNGTIIFDEQGLYVEMTETETAEVNRLTMETEKIYLPWVSAEVNSADN